MMPFYGDVALFKTAVSSVVAQTDPHWRLVVIDDRYPDDEPARFLELLGDDRIEYVLNEVNLGVSGNFQRAVDLARSSHVTIMGCDDVLLPEYVERVRQLIERYPDAAYFQPGVEVIDGGGAVVVPLADRVKKHYRPAGSGPRVLAGEELAESLLRGNWTYFPSLCWATAVVQSHGFREDYSIVLDLALQLSIIEGGGSLVLDDRVVFQYRRHESVSSWSGSGIRRFHEEKALFREAASGARRRGWPRAARAARWHLTSRLNAAVQLTRALRSGGRGLRTLLRHVFGG